MRSCRFLGAGCLTLVFGLGTNAMGQVPVKNADIAVERIAAERAAESAASSLTELESSAEAYQRQEFTLQADGNLVGKVMSFDSEGTAIPARAKIYLLRGSEIVTQAMPNEEGVFQAADLQPGLYSVVVAGQSGFAATGVRVLPPPQRPDAPKTNTIGMIRASQPAAVEPRFTTFAIQPVDVQPAFYLAQQFVPGMSAFSAGSMATPPGQAAPQAKMVDPSASRPIDVPATLAAAEAAERTAAAESVLHAYETHEFALDSSGALTGQLRMYDDAGRLTPANVRLFFLRGGRVLRQADPDAAGGFGVQGIEPGYYSLVAAGPSGFAAVGVRVIPAPDRPQAPKASTIGRVRNISLNQQPGGVPLNLFPVRPNATFTSFQIAGQQGVGGLTQTPNPFTPFGGGAPGGGGGGVGGGGGGFGGMGALLAAGLGAGGLAAGLSNNNGGTSSSTTTTSSNNGP